MQKIARKDRRLLLTALSLALAGLYCFSFTTDEADEALRTRRTLSNEGDVEGTSWSGSIGSNSSILSIHDPEDDPWWPVAHAVKLHESLPQWILDYVDFHAEALRRARADPSNDPNQYLVYRCIAQCGGAADRQRGIHAMFLQAIFTNRVFLIDHPNPVPLDQILVPNLIEWNATLPILNDETKVTIMSGMNFEEEFYYNDVLDPEKVTSEMSVVKIQTNMPVQIDPVWKTDASNKFFSKNYGIENERAGKRLAPPRELIKWIFITLYRPSDALIQKTKEVRASLGLKDDSYYVAVHVRIGTTEKWNDNVFHSIEDVPKFLQCAKGQQEWLRSTHKLPNPPPIVVVSDDVHPKERLKELDSTLLYADTPIIHVEKTRGADNNLEANLNVFSDMMILAQGSCMTMSASGFSELGMRLSLGENGFRCSAHFKRCDRYVPKPITAE